MVYTVSMCAKSSRLTTRSPEKNSLHFGISDVAKMLDLSPSTLRIVGEYGPDRSREGLLDAFGITLPTKLNGSSTSSACDWKKI